MRQRKVVASLKEDQAPFHLDPFFTETACSCEVSISGDSPKERAKALEWVCEVGEMILDEHEIYERTLPAP